MAAIFVSRRAGNNYSGSTFHSYKLFLFVGFCVLSSLFNATNLTANNNIHLQASTTTTALIKFDNCSQLATLSIDQTKDSLVIYSRTTQIAIPPDGSVSIVSSAGAKLHSIETLSAGYSTTNYLASLGEPITVRGRRLVSLTVYPVSRSGIYDEIEVELQFSGQTSAIDMPAKPDPFFDRVLKANVINFDQMKSWRAVKTSNKISSQASALAVSLAGDWIKLSVTETGLYSVSGAQLEQAGMSLVGLASDNVRIYNAGGRRINMPNEQARPAFKEIATYIQDGGDGQFDAGDKIYFYGEAVDRWIYPAGATAHFENNSYTADNIYWLPISSLWPDPPVRMTSISGRPTGAADTTITEVWGRAHAEQDSLLLKDPGGHVDDYSRFYWSNSSNVSFFVNTPGLIAGDEAQVSIIARSGGTINATFNGNAGSPELCNRFSCGFTTSHLVNGLNQINLVISPDGSHDPGLDYLNITYQQLLTPDNNNLQFAIDDYSGTALFSVVDNFSGTPVVFEITDPTHPNIFSGVDNSNNIIKFETELIDTIWNHFLVTQLNQAKTPDKIEQVTVNDLRSISEQVDMFIITPELFTSALDEYIEYRQSDSLSIRVVTVEEIMDNFGFGLYDPAAIRDFLKYAYENYTAPVPATVLLVGDANHDFLDVLQTGVPNHVPAFIHRYPIFDISYSDDNYVYFDKYGILDSDTSRTRVGDHGVDMFIARWPVTSVAEINVIVQKIKSYESSNNYGSWRSRIILVADDEFGETFNSETFHTTDSEKLDALEIPATYNLDKIYMIEYPKVGSDKPSVNDAIVRSVNDGALILNYVGHGNPDVWAHEHVFQRGSDLPRLNNYDKLSLVFAASCAIGFFDDPKREGMAEDFLVMPGGGAIGVVSATRLVYAGDNAMFNRAVYNILFNETDLTICEAMFAAKLRRQYLNDTTMYPVTNDRAYAFFGDPLINLGIPSLGVVFDEYPDTLVALGRHHVTGHLIDSGGELVSEDGELFVNLYDSDRNMTYRLTGNSDIKIDYTKLGPTLFRGKASVNQGEFAFDFVTPLDVGYGGQSAKLSVYSVLESIDGIGATGSLVISDQVTVSTDSIGPKVEFGFDSQSDFVSGDNIRLGRMLEISLSDSSGINLSGGFGHGIVLEIDSDPSATVVLNDLFEYDTDDFMVGKIAYSLKNLEVGTHNFKIRAWDNANNSTTVEFTANIVMSAGLSIVELLNYPNPMSNSTTFYFELNDPVELFVIEIFTLSGKIIKSFNRSDLPADNYPNDSYSLTWDGRDSDGDRVATGVYIYKATAQNSLSDERTESFGKIVVIN